MTPAGFRMAMYKYTCYMYMSSSTCRYCQGMYTYTYYTSIYCIVGNMAGFPDPINISHVTGHVCTSVHSESVYSHIRMWLLNGVRYMASGEMVQVGHCPTTFWWSIQEMMYAMTFI